MKLYINASSQMVPNRLNLKKLSNQINSIQSSFNNNTNNEENTSESSENVMITPIEKQRK
jgi:hypothetical protein